MEHQTPVLTPEEEEKIKNYIKLDNSRKWALITENLRRFSYGFEDAYKVGADTSSLVSKKTLENLEIFLKDQIRNIELVRIQLIQIDLQTVPFQVEQNLEHQITKLIMLIKDL